MLASVAVHELQAFVQVEFIARGMTAEVVVVVEQEKAARSAVRAVEMGGRQDR